MSTPDTVQIGFGTTFGYSTDNGTHFHHLAKITGFTPNKISVNPVSVDAFDNATFNGLPVEDTIPGWVKPGTYAIKLWYLSGQYGTLRSLTGVDGTLFKVHKPDGSGGIFSGYIMEIGEEIPLKEGMECDINIQINGGVPSFQASISDNS